ncbi:MAG TPA: hypothetical protein VMV57_11705, partial [Terracidiphilus sp.]|nr:hypothetical protein [Terracidiphilus sp.]
MKATIQSIQWTAGLLLLAGTVTALAYAQDTHYAPTGQQIPPPACLTLRGAWEGGYIPCTAATHQQWLA